MAGLVAMEGEEEEEQGSIMIIATVEQAVLVVRQR